MSDEFALIHSYSRAQAIADGVLVDVTTTAKEAGLKYPTAVTQAVFERYIRVPDGLNDQDEVGRTWDLLWMLRFALARSANTDSLIYTVLVKTTSSAGPLPVELKALCHPGDDAEPVITILLPDED